MRLDNLTDVIIDLLGQDSYFDDMRIINAYPPAAKPTRLTRVNIAIGINKIELEPYQIDCDDIAGEISVFVDIFVPLSSDIRLVGSVFSRICSVLNKYNIRSICADRVSADSSTQAYVLRSTVTFGDTVDFGGDNDGQ